ncbi:NAD(P)-dependent oxidoreductase [Lactiplantibacillus fabifermentans T30PCM01]|uniref:NAD(P)-dependent oxidoreductase n=1 Tax=Lactiplantibacillus fabifermentans T30PCM01 TaxID=1400520 RepID=W6T3V7_9LACO|nr:NAD(P)H-binding protein [Lactiplantibacillus fabifermentans]ETY72567.1 NAD(P)-dependent oxidoreductase [Lactiplantibacillus fabifermentans T30PCM01]
MKKVLIIGATGTLGGAVRQTLLKTTDSQLTLFSRNVGQLKFDEQRERAINGNVRNRNDLVAALADQDVVFAALSGDMAGYAQSLVDAMQAMSNPPKLIFITTMGIYQEIPSWLGTSPDPYQNGILRSYRQAADIIEGSALNYTLIRPGWFTSGPVNYEITHKGEPFGGHDASVASIADLVQRLVLDVNLGQRDSLGINTPANQN